MSMIAHERIKTNIETLENAVQQHTSGAENNTHNYACKKSAQLDTLLFTAPYFLIDADNHKVSDMLTTRPEHTQQPIVGTLHPNVLAIDFDLDTADEADWALHHLITWCEDRSTWYAHRASGGGPGRVHFLALPRKEYRDELANYIEQLRIELGATKTQIDVRDKLRLLSSPHRHGHSRGRLVTAWATPPAELLHGTPRPRQRRTLSSPVHDTSDQLTERQRHLAATLDCQEAIDQTRSGIEFLIALRLKALGATADAAFNALCDPTLRDDIGKAAEKGYTWFYTHVWEKINVEPAISAKTYDWATYALPMSRAVRESWGHWPTRHKHTVEHVAVVAAARIGAHGAAGGPLPLRDLVEDTGIDKDTVSAALKTLRETGLLIRTKRFRITEESVANSSDHYALAIELAPTSLTPTTSLYTPLPHAPAAPLWLALPPAALSATLTLMHSGQALTLTNLLQLTGYKFQTQPSTRQKALGRALLQTMEDHGLLATTDQDTYELHTTSQDTEKSAAGLDKWTELRAKHRKERKTFREAVTAIYEKARELKAAWNKARAEAIERTKQHRRAGQLAWWASLTPASRERRSEIYKETWWNSTEEERQVRQAKIDASRPATDPPLTRFIPAPPTAVLTIARPLHHHRHYSPSSIPTRSPVPTTRGNWILSMAKRSAAERGSPIVSEPSAR